MRHFPLILFGVLFLLCTSVFGQAAKQHFFAGQSYYEQGRYQKAVGEFEEAYRLDPRPLLLFNISQAYERLGDLQKALDYLRNFVEKDPKNDNIQTHRDKIRNLEQRIAKTGIQITSDQGEAAIYVDDVEVGSTPHDGVIPVGVGQHLVRVTKPGYQDFVMNVAISWGYAVPINAQLTPGAGSPATTQASEPTDNDSDYSTLALEDDVSPGKFRKALPWIVAGTGAALSVVGWAGIGYPAYKTVEDPLSSPDEVEQAKQDSKSADAIGILGLAGVAVGTIWGIVELKRRKNPETLASGPGRLMVSPVVSHESVAFSATLRF